jgi:hypothetical protein
MKQTAVEWLSDNLWVLEEQITNKEITLGQYAVTRVTLVEQAKEMEKEQIMEAHYAPKYGCFSDDYYNKTFNTNEK